MGLLLSIIREEEEESEPLVNGCQNIQKDSLSSDVHGASHLLSQTSPISHGNTTSWNERPNNIYRAAEKKQQASLKFCHAERKSVLPAVSKEKIMYPQNSTTKSDSVYFADTRSKNVISVDSKEELIPQKDTAEADSVHFSDSASKNVVSAVSKEKLIHQQKATAKPESVLFSDTASKRAFLADSMEKLIRKKATSKPDSVNFSDTSSKNLSSADSEGKLICLQKLTSKTDSMHFPVSASKNARSANSKKKPIYRQKASTNLDSVHFSNATSKKVVSEDSKEKLIHMQKTTSKPESVHFSDRISANVFTADSKGKLIYRQKASTKPDSAQFLDATSKKIVYADSKEKLINMQKTTSKPESVHFSDITSANVSTADSKGKLIYRQKSSIKLDSVQFLDATSKKIVCEDSKEKFINMQKTTSKPESVHFSDRTSANVSTADSKGKLIYRQKSSTKLDSVQFLDATSKKIVCEDSKEKLINMQKTTSKPESVHFSDRTSANVSTADSKGKLIYQQKAITKTESVDLSNTLGKKVSSVVSKEKITLQKATTKPDSVHLLDTANIEVLSVDSKEKPIHRRKATNKSLVTVSARLHSEFCAAPEKQESRSEPHEKVSMSSVMIMERRIQDYCSSQKILLVGEGDFSFSACLARAFGMAINMVATSLDSKAYLRSNYKNAMDNISLLRMRGCKVLHRVDATDIHNHKMIKDIQFDRIIYNFPHAGFFKYTKSDRRKNQRLVRLFMENSVKIIKEDGEIHIRHKSTSFFLQWNLKGLATEAGLVLMEEANFNASEFEGYNTKYGYEGGKFSSDKNFNCHPSCTYKFVLSKRQKKLDELSHSDLRKPVRNAQSQQKITKSKAQSIQRKSASKKLTTRQVFRTKGNQPWPRQPEVINQYPIELDQLRAHQKGLLKGYNNLLEDVKGLEQTMAADHANFA